MSVIALVAAITEAHKAGLEVTMIQTYNNLVYVAISTKRNQDGSYDRVFADRHDENDVEGMISLIEHATKQIVEFPL